MLIVELGNSKLYRIYDDHSINLNQIYRRTNELFVFEHITRIHDLPI